MSSKPQSIIRRVSACVTKELRRRLLLVTADSNAHHVAIAVAHSNFKYIACRFRAKLAHGVENPEHRFSKGSNADENAQNVTSEFRCSGFSTPCASLARKRHAMYLKLLCATAIATWWALESAVTSRRRRRSSFVTHTLTRRIMDCGLLLMPGKAPGRNQFGAR